MSIQADTTRASVVWNEESYKMEQANFVSYLWSKGCFQCKCLYADIVQGFIHTKSMLDCSKIQSQEFHRNTVCTQKSRFLSKKCSHRRLSTHVTHTRVHHVILVCSFFNDLLITLSLVIEMTAMHYYTSLMVCNYFSSQSHQSRYYGNNFSHNAHVVVRCMSHLVS